MLWYFAFQLAGEACCALFDFSLFLNTVMRPAVAATYLAHPIAAPRPAG
jgi:hypothetical protein